jgi:hypothetical protein
MADYSNTTDIIANAPETSIASSTDSTVITALGYFITRASRLIDREVGRWDNYFYPSSDDTTRYYDGTDEGELEIDDCLSITTLSVAESGGTGTSDYTDWATTDYLTYPYNSAPFRRLVIDFNGSKGFWYPFRKSVKIVGVFGYSLTPPADVTQACDIQSLRWYMRAKQGYQDVSANADLGQTELKYALDPDIVALLAHYKSRNIV